jgi:hypothetical protein
MIPPNLLPPLHFLKKFLSRFVLMVFFSWMPFFNLDVHGQCDSGYSLSPSSGNYPATAGSASFNVSVPPGCGYYAVPGTCFSWIGDVTSGPTGTVTFFRSANNSCASRSCAISVANQNGQGVATFNVTQQGLGNIAQPGVISGPGTFCDSEPQQYSISSVTNATSYTWTFTGEGTPVGTGTSVQLTPLSSGTLSVVANNSCGSGPPRTLELTLLDIPMAPDSIMGASAFCSGESETFSIPSVPGDNTYTWTFDGEEVYNGPDTTVTFSPANSGTLSVSTSNFCGESAETSFNINLQLPPVQPGSIIGDSVVCINTEHVYSIDPVEGANSYMWSLPSSWSGSSDSTSLQASLETEGGLLEVVAMNQCGTSPATTFQVNVAVSVVNPGLINGPDELCTFEISTYFIDSVPGAVDYIWTLPDGWEGELNNESVEVSANDESGDVQVQIYDGCGLSNTESLSVTINDVPAMPSNIEGNTLVCAGDIEIYTVNNDPNSDSYQWTLPDSSWIGTSSGPSIEVTAGSGSGVLEVIAVNECGASPAQTVILELILMPEALAPVSGDTLVCINQQIMYLTNAVPGIEYLWTITGASESSITTTASEVSVTWIETGQQTISVAAVNDCYTGPITQLFVIVDECTSIEEFTDSGSWNLYPNPVGDFLFLEFSSKEIVNRADITIYDTSGRMVRTVNSTHSPGNQESITIQTGDLDRGLYVLQITDSRGMQSLQFVKL